VHLAHLGFPLCGDDKYGDFALNKALQKQGLDRMFLHARKAGAGSSATGERLELAAGLPEKLLAFLRRLEDNEETGLWRNYRLVVFDWDGTLLDSAAAIVASIQAAARDLGLRPPGRKNRAAGDRPGLARCAVASLAGRAGRGLPAQVAERYRHHYLAQDHELSLFAGARELVEELAEPDACWGWPPARAGSA
jgi:hypothetical protein